MPIIDNSKVQKVAFPGLEHQTIAGLKQGAKAVEVWMQTAELNTETPLHYHDCEEIIIVLQGSGEAIVAGKATDFGPNTTIIVPPKVVHKMKGTGSEKMFVIAVLSKASPKTYFPDGRLMPLPWQES